MAVKVIMTWNIKSGREREYFGFVVGQYLPGANRLGLDLTDAWLTVYGDQPQVMVGALLPGVSEARDLLNNEAWESLTDQLMDFVEDYTFKVVSQKGTFQF